MGWERRETTKAGWECCRVGRTLYVWSCATYGGVFARQSALSAIGESGNTAAVQSAQVPAFVSAYPRAAAAGLQGDPDGGMTLDAEMTL